MTSLLFRFGWLCYKGEEFFVQIEQVLKKARSRVPTPSEYEQFDTKKVRVRTVASGRK
jgi:hypothetical protein